MNCTFSDACVAIAANEGVDPPENCRLLPLQKGRVRTGDSGELSYFVLQMPLETKCMRNRDNLQQNQMDFMTQQM